MRKAAGLLAGAILLGNVVLAHAQTRPSIMPIADVRPGMRGYGLTVFEGTEPERFDVEVVGVMRNFLPRQDVILVKMNHPTLDHSGIVGGMSGSPVYLEGRLAGAVAYGWRFAKDPVAGVTPIERMLPELDRPLRGLPGATLQPLTPGPAPAKRRPRARLDRAPDFASAFRPTDGYFRRFEFGGDPDEDEDMMVPVSTPITLAGFSPQVRRALSKLLEPWGVVPLQGAGGSPGGVGRGDPPRTLVPGGGLGVQLMRGDMDATGIGTVTHVENGKFLGFGHPMMNLGEQYFPVTTARVHMFLANLQRSFKIADPIQEVGAMTQDRQAAIAGDLTKRAKMIPGSVVVHDRSTGREERFHVEMVQHRFLTPALAFSLVADAIADGTQDLADLRYVVRSKVMVSGHGTMEFEDHGWSVNGYDPFAISGIRALGAMNAVTVNPFEDVAIEGMEFDVDVTYDRDVHEVRGVHLTSDEVAPGQRVNVYVTLRPYDGAEVVRAIPVEVPDAADGTEMEIEVSSGDIAPIEQAEPESVAELIENLEQGYPATSLVVSIKLPSQGVAIRGHVVEDLPPSAIAALRPTLASETPDTFSTRRQVEHPYGHLAEGRASVTVRVRTPGTGSR